MALDSTPGSPTAESYISVADADLYFSDRGNTAWAALDTPAKEAALRIGCDYMEANYATRWCGEKATTTQALSWPRTGTSVASDVVPIQVQRANAELAIRSSQSGGQLQGDQSSQVKQEVVGPISVTYQDGARQTVKYTQVEAMLESSGLMCRGVSNQIPVIRA